MSPETQRHPTAGDEHADAERARVVQALGAAQELLRSDLDATRRLLEVGSLFLREGNLQAVLGEIVEAAIAIAGADFGNVQLRDPGSGDLRIAAHRGFPEWWLEFWDQTSLGQGSCGTALGRRERVIVEDVETSPVFVGTPALEIQLKAGVRAVQSTPILGRAGQPIGMLSTHSRKPGRPDERALHFLDLLCRQASDILERAQAEEALAEANRRLVEAGRRKDEFLGILSHELRNPLTPIRNSLHLLNHFPSSGEPARRAQAIIDRQVAHLARLVEDLLDVTRIASGKVQLQREILDLNELAQRAAEDHRAAFAKSEVDLQVLAAPAAVWVSGDQTRLSQVIGNLLQNAVKFTPRGGSATVSVETDAARRWALVRVKDTGPGIAPEVVPRLFEAFSQGAATLDRSKDGLGLGLAVVKGLMELHGGAVRGDSAGPGQGAAFTIGLPLAAGPAAALPACAEAGVAPRRVLVIDDNVDAADTLKDVLELGGHEVVVAYTGPEGLEKARAFAPAFVLCDIGLPGMNGYEVARAMRADPALGRITLVALTGYKSTEDVDKARQAGFDGHLAKPPSIESLERVLGAGPP